MKKLTTLVLCIMLTPIALHAGDVEKELMDVIDGMISILEKKDHKAFVEKYMPPGMLEAAKNEGELESIIKVFSEQKADKLLEHLKKAKKIKPVIDENNIAVYNEEGFYLPIKLVKIGDQWYLK